MKSRERARRVLADIVTGPIRCTDAAASDETRFRASIDLSPERSEKIIATALAEARAHGAAIVLHLLRTIAGFDDSTMIKLAGVIERALELDEQNSSEPEKRSNDRG